MERLDKVVREIAEKYPGDLRDYAMSDIRRTAFHVELLVSRKGTDISVCDVGGGYTLFSAACAAVGMRSTVIDDFRDPVHGRLGAEPLRIHRELGVHIVTRDVVADGLGMPPASLDAVTSFDSVEHWHNSPKRLFHEIVTALRPNGLFVLSAPNPVNLRKRITVPLGHGKWSSMNDWYESEVFRSHVREPDVDDLRYIARDLQLKNVEVMGRNWLGYVHGNRLVRSFTTYLDPVLRLRPSVCADIYVLGST